MIILARLVTGFILAGLFFRMLQGAMTYQMMGPPLFELDIEISFRIFKFLQLDRLVVDSSLGSVIFSISLFLTGIMCFLFPNRNYLFPAFTILFFIYYLAYNTFIVHHSHQIAAAIWITVPFWAKKGLTRKFLWEAMRYYACFVYVMTCFVKFKGGAIYEWNNGVNSVKLNLAEYLYHYPDALAAKILSFTISHPFILNIGHDVVILLEGAMVVGFFTKKYDKWLLWIPVIVHLSTYFFSDVFFMEMLVLVFLFFSDTQLAYIHKRVPFLAR